MEILTIALSKIAESFREKQLAAWIAYWEGVHGQFSIEEIPWIEETFYTDRDFFLRGIKAAGEKLGWHLLDYAPGDSVQESLSLFELLVSQMECRYVRSSTDDLVDDYGCAGETCERHGIYLNLFGCILCRNPTIK